jgi:hypothetical protein
MQQIYQNSLFLYVYNTFKSVWGWMTGTTELYRICDAVVCSIQIKPIELPENVDRKMYVHKLAIPIQLDAETLFRIDQCILHSEKLDEFRRVFEAWYSQFEVDPHVYIEPGTGSKFEELYQMMIQIKKFPRVGSFVSPQALVLRSGMTQVFASFQLLHELNARAAARYDSTVALNERKLKEIWDMMMPGKDLEGRYTLQWQQIGFQGKDPSTDFRAMGLLALDNLHYFCEKYRDEARRVLQASHHPVSWFSFGILGINLTAYVLRLVRTRQLQYIFYQYGISKELFNEVYCFLFDAFEKHWSSLEKPPSMLEFNGLFKKFQLNFEIHLLQRRNVLLTARTKPSPKIKLD